jgi:hypothetical protein
MISEDYVSFETAKQLEENGFPQSLDYHYRYVINEFETGNHFNSLVFRAGDLISESLVGKYSDTICRPTLQMVLKWLKEIYNILIVVDYEYEFTDDSYYYKIYKLDSNGKPSREPIKGVSYDKDNNPTEHIIGYRDYEKSYKNYMTYKEACEGAINYCIENLI